PPTTLSMRFPFRPRGSAPLVAAGLEAFFAPTLRLRASGLVRLSLFVAVGAPGCVRHPGTRLRGDALRAVGEVARPRSHGATRLVRQGHGLVAHERPAPAA